jgi:alkyldihydroxyacetonephosphate synthase
MLVAANGGRMQVHRAIGDAVRIARRHGGVHMGRKLGEAWRRGRFRAPYLRDTLWAAGYAVDTVETATTWAALPATLAAIESALDGTLDDDDESVLRFTHLSHIYASGASLYTTFAFRRAPTAEATLDRWMRLREAASRAIVGAGATISHHHGVGTVHASWLVAEKGEAGLRALAASIGALDADGIMSPGVLLPTGTPRLPHVEARRAER